MRKSFVALICLVTLAIVTPVMADVSHPAEMSTVTSAASLGEHALIATAAPLTVEQPSVAVFSTSAGGLWPAATGVSYDKVRVNAKTDRRAELRDVPLRC